MKAIAIPRVLPEGYRSKLDYFQTEDGIKLVKDTFERKLAHNLSLKRVSAPRFLITGTGLQDDLAGTQVPVRFSIKFTKTPIEMVHSLAKWKRYTLGRRGFDVGSGLYTDMDAIRKDEEVSPIHSVYVDQWDWELVMNPEHRTIAFLKSTVCKIYEAIKETKAVVRVAYPTLDVKLPDKISFVHSEELEVAYPDNTPKEREYQFVKEHGAMFLIGLGHPLESGEPHDLRAADYDDWSKNTSAETGKRTRGLNGDIIVWDSVRQDALELSSMGIRVDADALVFQLELAGLTDRKELEFQKGILESAIPQTVGGGIGQSRLCMALLEKAHIGEVQSSEWPENVREECERRGVPLL